MRKRIISILVIVAMLFSISMIPVAAVSLQSGSKQTIGSVTLNNEEIRYTYTEGSGVRYVYYEHAGEKHVVTYEMISGVIKKDSEIIATAPAVKIPEPFIYFTEQLRSEVVWVWYDDEDSTIMFEILNAVDMYMTLLAFCGGPALSTTQEAILDVVYVAIAHELPILYFHRDMYYKTPCSRPARL